MNNYVVINFLSGVQEQKKIDTSGISLEEANNLYVSLCNQMVELSVESNEEVTVSLVSDSKEVRSAVFK